MNGKKASASSDYVTAMCLQLTTFTHLNSDVLIIDVESMHINDMNM